MSKEMFTGDWGKLKKLLRQVDNGTVTKILTNDTKNLANEFYTTILKGLETHGDSIGEGYGDVGDSWQKVRDEGIVGYLRGRLGGTYTYHTGSFFGAGYHTGAYAAAIRPRVIARDLRRGITICVRPDRFTEHQYYFKGDQEFEDPIPMWELAEILEAKYPHWQPTIDRLQTMQNYKKLIDLQSLSVLLK